MSTTQDQVRVLLDLAGIDPMPSEFDEIVAAFPELKARVERLWALELGDTAPSMVFRAAEGTGPLEVVR